MKKSFLFVLVLLFVTVVTSCGLGRKVPLFKGFIYSGEIIDEVKLALAQENIVFYDNGKGRLTVTNEDNRLRALVVLTERNLIPMGIEPCDFLDVDEYSMTDFERQEKKALAVRDEIVKLIERVDGVQNANVIIRMTEDSSLTESQKPITASVIVTTSGADLSQKKVKTIQKLLLFTIPGLREEFITISDESGRTLTDFDSSETVDRYKLIERTEMHKLKISNEIRARVIMSIKDMYSDDRVRNLDINLDMDTSKVNSEKTIYAPIIITEQDISNPYDKTGKRDTLPLSFQTITKEWAGTSYNPNESAVSGTDGNSQEQNGIANDKMPAVDRITVRVNVDGEWTAVTDDKGRPVFVTEKNIDKLKVKYPGWENSDIYRFEPGHQLRIYKPVSSSYLEQTANKIQAAVGDGEARNYTLVITNIKIDRIADFDREYELNFNR